MKLGSILWRSALVAALAAGAAQYWLVHRSHEVAAQVAARLIPYGGLRYEKLWANLWGTGTVWKPSFELAGILALSLQTPPGYRVQARELRIHELGLGGDGGLERLRGTLLGLEFPVPERRAPLSEAPDPADVPPPTLHDLGYASLRFDLDFSLQYVRENGLALITIDAAGADIGRLHLDGQLEGSPLTFDRAPDQILIRRLGLEFADGGLLTRYKALAAARSRASASAWEQAMIARIERLTAQGKWHWDEASAQAMRHAIRDSDYLRASIDPPSDVALRNIRLYPVGDWPRLLGFAFVSEGVFDHPVPGEGSR